ncbi:MAG: hypothetical protein ABI690_19300 [Chloroflexota bacterium]
MRFITKGFKRYDAVLFVVALLSVLLYIKVANGGFPLDDSWIHQVYGRNLAQTGQWAFVPGVPSAASTSPLFTVLLSIGYRLNIPYTFWTYALGIIALWVAGMLAARMTERLLPKPKYAGIIGGLAVIGAWHLIWAASSGMETMLFSMWTLILISLSWRELDERSTTAKDIVLRGVSFGVLAGLATVTRPEGVALAGLIGLIMLIVRPQKSWRGVIIWGVSAGVAFMVVISPYLLLNLSLTGGLLPDTAAAKQAENAPLLAVSYPGRIINFLFHLFAGGQILLIPGMIYFGVVILRQMYENRRALLFLIPLLWAVGLIALYAARLPAPYQHGRYVIPALPSLILTGVVGTAYLIQRGQRSTTGRVLSRSLAISTGLAFVYFAFIAGPGVYGQDVRIIDEEMVASAHWIADHIPPEQLLAVHDIGAVGYFAPRPIIDLAGLVSPEIIPFITDPDPLWKWMQDRGARYLMAFPDQIPGKRTDDPRLCVVFTTNGVTSPAAGGPNMTVYELAWDGICPPH